MGIDQAKRKRVSTKAALKSTTAVAAAVPASDRVVSKSDNQPKLQDTVYRDTLDRAHDYCVKAYASDEAADKMKGRGAQFMAAAIVEAYPVWCAQGKVSQGDTPSLATTLTSDRAMRLVTAAATEHFAGDKRPTGNNVQEQTEFALRQSAHKALVKRGLVLAAHLSAASVNISMFDADAGHWHVPFPMLVPANVRVRMSDEHKARIVALDNAPWGVTIKDHRGSDENVRFRSSERQFIAMTKPKPATTPAAAATTTTAQREARAGTPPTELADRNLDTLSVDKLTGHNGLLLPKAVDVVCSLWFSEGKHKTAEIKASDFTPKQWENLAALAASITSVMERIKFNAADAVTTAKAA